MATRNVKLGIADDESVIKMEFAKPVGGKYKLQFTGAVEAEWDGTKPVTVEIPDGKIKTVNGKEPDEEGNVKIDIPKIPEIPTDYVKTVNGIKPDENGNVKVDAIDKESIDEAVNKALTKAKESGLFDGKDGKDGAPGEKGDTGEKGEPGQPGEKGDKGEPGSDATVTTESIETALGYKPANENELKEAKIIVSNDEPEDGAFWIDPDTDEEVILAEIDDDKVSDETTWSSEKINAMFTEYVDEIAELVGGDA